MCPEAHPTPQAKRYHFRVLDRETVNFASTTATRRALLVGLAAIPVAGASGAALSLLGTSAQAGPPAAPQEILLVTYAVTKAAYDQIIPQFTAHWKK